MSFSNELREHANPVFEAILQHPFVQGIGKGQLPPEALIHYVKQDFEYLNTFMQIYGLAINKSTTREDIALFNEQISFILHSEIHPHNNFCQVAGVSYDELHYEPLAPTAHHYTRHMLDVAQKGSLAEILAVLLPCPWTYQVIGDYLYETFNPTKEHPFYDWISFYRSNGEMNVTALFCQRLDELAKDETPVQKQQMLDHFVKSCQLELAFWEMAYTNETWPVSLEPVT
ncbi:thiaminase II [Shouchella lehensis]|uniref:Aminopyrimidine aminohydrolase n=1 Tax=Shouchella lehensis TaxID=300825 RepID=A0A4Y7WEI1_9BACI|nr:thiaminase II [Shouchella lehensis]MBG9784802.1 TenA family transcriptional regulator [Shouchella lehensis]TES46209.1 thiaminase II [Shouchella lehensis]